MKIFFIYLVILLSSTSLALADASVYYCTSTNGGYDEPGKEITKFSNDDNFKAKIDFENNYMLIKGSRNALPYPLNCYGGDTANSSNTNTMTCIDNTGYTIFIEKNSLKFAHSVLWGIVSKDSNKQIVVGYGSCEKF